MKYKLADIAVVSAGQGAPQGEQNYCDDGIPFVKAGNLQELLSGTSIDNIQRVNDSVAKKHKLKLYEKGSVLFAKSGMSWLKGYVYVLPKDAYVVSHLACVTPKKVPSEYLRYYFQYHRPNQLVKDESYPSISLSDISDMEVSIPSDGEFAKIIDPLQKTEQIISARRQQLSELDTLVKARFVEMFGDFDLSHNRPEWLPISSIGTVVGGSTPKTSNPEYWDGELRWISPAELKNDSGIIFDSVRKITKAGAESCSLQELPIGTVILSSRAPIGKVAIAGNTFYCNQGFKNIICNEKVLPRYLYSLLLFNTDYLNSLGRGATFKEISKSIVEQVQIPVPPLEQQKEFETFVAQVDKSRLFAPSCYKMASIV